MSSAVIAERPADADADSAPLGGADISDYLHTLYDAASKDDKGKLFAVTAFPSKVSRFFHPSFDGISDATLHIKGLERQHMGVEKAAVYTSMYLLDAAPAVGRGKAADVTALRCLWIDLDIGKPGYAQNEDDARSIAAALKAKYDVSPSMLTSSGYGLHAYYIFREPLPVSDEGERKDVTDLLLRWKAVACDTARELGFTVDAATFDLARVLRVAGSANWKDAANPKPARIIERHDVRYSYEDFDAVLPPLADVQKRSMDRSATSPSVDVVVGDLVFDPDAVAPFDKFTSLMATNPKFVRTWARKRSDLRDQSGSGYCMSLADAAALAGWTPQEIMDLLIAWRRANLEELKADNVNSYVLTIKKALASAGDAAITRDATAATDGQVYERESREAATARLKDIFAEQGIHVKGARKLGVGAEGHIGLILADGRSVPLGVTADAINQKRVIAAIAAETLTVVQGWSPQVWRNVAQTILRAAGEGEAIGTSPAEMMCTWLAAYIKDSRNFRLDGKPYDKPYLSDKLHVAYVLMQTPNNQPFWTADDRLVVHPETFVSWLTSDKFGTRAEVKDVRRWLRELDFEPERLEPRYSWKAIVERFEPDRNSQLNGHGRAGGKADEGKITRRVLISPPGFDPN